MLYTQNMSKSALDRSSRSITDRFQQRINDIDLRTEALRRILLDMSDDIDKVKERAETDRERAIEVCDETKTDFHNKGITGKDDEINHIKEVLEGIENDLDDVLSDIDTTIACLDMCQACFDVVYTPPCNDTPSCNDAPVICREGEAITCTECDVPYLSCLRCFNTCNNCQTTFTTCDQCYGGTYTSDICTNNNTTCTNCDNGCDACQTNCYGAQTVECPSCYGAEDDVPDTPYQCINNESSSCFITVMGCSGYGFEKPECTRDNGIIEGCPSNFVCNFGNSTADKCESNFNGCQPSYQTTCSNGYSDDGGNICDGNYSDNGCTVDIGNKECTGGFQNTQTQCEGQYVECENNQVYCQRQYNNTSAGGGTGCVNEYAYDDGTHHCKWTYKDGGETKCDQGYNDHGTKCETCQYCEESQAQWICTKCNTVQTTCTTCVKGESYCSKCYTTTYMEEYDTEYFCDASYDACNVAFKNCMNTRVCPPTFGQAAGCGNAQGCGTCQSACQNCQGSCPSAYDCGTCQSNCQNCQGSCPSSYSCGSCNTSCQVSCQSCDTSRHVCNPIFKCSMQYSCGSGGYSCTGSNCSSYQS